MLEDHFAKNEDADFDADFDTLIKMILDLSIVTHESPNVTPPEEFSSLKITVTIMVSCVMIITLFTLLLRVYIFDEYITCVCMYLLYQTQHVLHFSSVRM